jgi:hypothetical protein
VVVCGFVVEDFVVEDFVVEDFVVGDVVVVDVVVVDVVVEDAVSLLFANVVDFGDAVGEVVDVDVLLWRNLGS